MSYAIDSSNRITGLASGLETDTIIKGLMASYLSKLDKQDQYTTKLEWTADAYREINTLIKNFRSKYLTSQFNTNMMTSSAYRNMTVCMQTSTNAVSISAASTAVSGTYTIDEISHLATAPKISSKEAFTGEKYLSDTTLGELELANKFTFDEEGKLSFSINGEVFSFTADTTIAQMMRTVNNSDAGVTMRFSTLTNGFSIYSDKTGSGSVIDIKNISGNAFSATDSALGLVEGVTKGEDAECIIEGMPVKQSTNTFSFDGVTYTLNAESNTPIEFSVEQDYQTTVDSIVGFVDAYNELVDTLQNKLKEEIFYDYPPLTDEQREDMDDKEIEQWEEKAKSGILRNDSYISTLLSTMRSAFYTKVDGTGMMMADIGLTTGAYYNGGKITVDADKLLAKLQEDPNAVEDMFVQTSEDGTFSEKGLMSRISDALLGYTEDTVNIALDTLDNKISDAKDTQSEMEFRMKEKEDALWIKFSKMEAELTRLNSMQSWLSGLFS